MVALVYKSGKATIMHKAPGLLQKAKKLPILCPNGRGNPTLKNCKYVGIKVHILKLQLMISFELGIKITPLIHLQISKMLEI